MASFLLPRRSRFPVAADSIVARHATGSRSRPAIIAGPPMDPDRKRKIRLVVALSAAVLLAAGLVYTSFNASNEAKEPSQLLSAQPGQTYDLTGVVVPGSVRHHGSRLDFRAQD